MSRSGRCWAVCTAAAVAVRAHAVPPDEEHAVMRMRERNADRRRREIVVVLPLRLVRAVRARQAAIDRIADQQLCARRHIVRIESRRAWARARRRDDRKPADAGQRRPGAIAPCIGHRAHRTGNAAW